MTLNGKSTELQVALEFQTELEFGNVGVWEEGKTRVPGKKTYQSSKDENQYQTQPCMTLRLWIKPGPLTGY